MTRHVIVLGAGVAGVSTAYYLASAGCRVTVIERAAAAGQGTSFANGGQLSYGFAESLATPGFVRKLPALLAGRDFAVRIRITPALFSWGLRFLAQCTPTRSRANTLQLLKLAARSARLMTELQAETRIGFAHRPAGKLVLLSTSEEVRVAEESTRMKRACGIDVELLSVVDAMSIEPAIANFTTPLRAAVYSRHDDVGDSLQFSVELQTYLQRQLSVEFHFSTPANKLVDSRGGVVGVRCGNSSQDTHLADAVVVCLGTGSSEVLKPLGIATRIYPVRGYSVTLPVAEAAPSASLTSLTNRFVFSRLDSRMRIAGFTDFNGFNSADDTKRLETLLAAARKLAPGFANYAAADKHPWGAFRPMTPSGLPQVGPTRIQGLYLNTGHGMLGWTLACATAKSVTDSIVGEKA